MARDGSKHIRKLSGQNSGWVALLCPSDKSNFNEQAKISPASRDNITTHIFSLFASCLFITVQEHTQVKSSDVFPFWKSYFEFVYTTFPYYSQGRRDIEHSPLYHVKINVGPYGLSPCRERQCNE